MAKVRIREEANCRLMTGEEFVAEKKRPGSDPARHSEEALATRLRIFHEGSDSSPQLFEAQILPHAVAAPHCHVEDEIIYILDGEMLLGNRSIGRGASVFIAAHTIYGFRAGPEGVKFLNFRTRRC